MRRTEVYLSVGPRQENPHFKSFVGSRTLVFFWTVEVGQSYLGVMMFVLLNIVGLFFALDMPSSEAISKMWIQNYNWEKTNNWNLGRLPCSNDIAKIEMTDVTVYMNSSSTVKELILPTNGSLVLGNSAVLMFSDQSSSQACKGSDISFTGCGSDNWFDPNNWQTAASTSMSLYPQQVPCLYDTVRFPQDSSYKVKITKNVTVSKVFLSGKEQDDRDFQQYIASSTGIQQIYLGKSVSVQITGKECQDPSGCMCGNSKQKDYICKFITCPKLQCKHPVKPIGGCCSICGTYLLLYVSDGFIKSSVEQKIENHLKKFAGVSFTVVKTADQLIQVVLREMSHPSDGESKTRMAAQSIRENLLTEENLHIRKIEIFPAESSKSFSSSQTTGLTIGIIVAVFVVVVTLTLAILYYRKRRTAQRGERFVDEIDMNQGPSIENPAFVIDGPNPLYESNVDTVMSGIIDAATPAINPEKNGFVERKNPLYDSGEPSPTRDKVTTA